MCIRDRPKRNRALSSVGTADSEYRYKRTGVQRRPSSKCHCSEGAKAHGPGNSLTHRHDLSPTWPRAIHVINLANTQLIYRYLNIYI